MRSDDTPKRPGAAMPQDHDESDTQVEPSRAEADDDRTESDATRADLASGTAEALNGEETVDETVGGLASSSAVGAAGDGPAARDADDATQVVDGLSVAEDITAVEPPHDATVVERSDDTTTIERPGDTVSASPMFEVRPARRSPPIPDDETQVLPGVGDDDRTSGATGVSHADDATSPQSQASGDEDSRRTLGGGGQGTVASGAPRRAAASEPRRGAADGDLARERPYVLIEAFAQGGLGRIWRARDVRIGREVAYKELLPKAQQHPDQIARFVEEAQVTGQLEHPGIVPVYDFGRKRDGAPFYCMKLVHGRTLRDAIREYHALPRDGRERRLAMARLLRNFVAVCNAVAFAHQRGVLHRDLKPLNIMLGEFGETFVLDWGMAKIVDTGPAGDAEGEPTPRRGREPGDETEATLAGGSDGSGGSDQTELPSRGSSARGADRSHAGSVTSSHVSRRGSVRTSSRPEGTETQVGSVMGTPNYMSPEQASGLLTEIDARSDIYSLGAVLYELLTNESPVPEKGLFKKIKYIIEGRLVPPRTHDASIPRPLEAICLRAMARRKEDRYQTGLALAADVEAWLADEPVSAYADPWTVRARRWARRHQTAVISGGVAAVLVVVGLVGWRVAESDRIEGARLTAEGRIAEAREALAAEDFGRADRLLGEAAGLVETEPALAALGTSIGMQLESVDRLRVAATRRGVDEKLAAAERVLREDPADARPHLTEAMAMVRDEPKLAELAGTVGAQLGAVEALIAERKSQTAARERFERFLAESDHARFHGGFFTGESVSQEAADAVTHATAALSLYELGGDAPPDFRPAHLSEEQAAKIRDTAFELMLILAEAEQLLARGEPTEKRQDAAVRALTWVGRAKGLGVTSRALFLREALALDQLGRARERDAARRSAEETPPATSFDHFLLGEIERKNESYDAALRSYRAALRLEPDHYWSLHFSGLCHVLKLEQATGPADRAAYAEAAVADYTAAIARRPDFPWSYLTRGVAYAELGQFDGALADLDTAGRLAPDLIGVPLNRGAVLLVQGKDDEAVAEFRRAAELRPDRADPHVNLAEAHRRRADRVQLAQGAPPALPHYQQSLAELTTAAGLSSSNPKIYRMRGDVQLAIGARREALRDYRRAVEFERSPARIAAAYRQIAGIYFGDKDYPAALDAYDDALAADASHADAHRLRGEALLKLGRREEAVAAFTRYLELKNVAAPPGAGEDDPVEALGDAYVARALARAELGQYRDAVSDYTRILELKPATPNVLTRRGWAYLLQSSTLALRDFEDAVRLEPENPDSYAGRGYARALLGDHAGAAEDAERSAGLARIVAQAQGPRAWPLVYNPATVLAQAAEQARHDAKLSAEERQALAERYTGLAVERLAEAGTVAGPGHFTPFRRTVETDPALDPVREHPGFAAGLEPREP